MIIVMGTPGAGKTTIIREFRKRHPNANVVSFGTLMFEIASHELGMQNRDDMRRLKRSEFRSLQNKAANRLLTLGKEIIVDTHASVKTADGYYPGFPYYVLSKLSVDAFIYIHASVKEILGRRKKDRSRKRDIESEHNIYFHEQINLSMVCSYSSYANAPIKFILNEDGKLEQSIKMFEECVRI